MTSFLQPCRALFFRRQSLAQTSYPRLAATRLSSISHQFSSSSTTMAPITREVDYLVIGAGSGGTASSRRAGGIYGAKSLVVESGPLGGTCVNVG